jgi:hypothetical protein
MPSPFTMRHNLCNARHAIILVMRSRFGAVVCCGSNQSRVFAPNHRPKLPIGQGFIYYFVAACPKIAAYLPILPSLISSEDDTESCGGAIVKNSNRLGANNDGGDDGINWNWVGKPRAARLQCVFTHDPLHFAPPTRCIQMGPAPLAILDSRGPNSV